MVHSKYNYFPRAGATRKSIIETFLYINTIPNTSRPKAPIVPLKDILRSHKLFSLFSFTRKNMKYIILIAKHPIPTINSILIIYFRRLFNSITVFSFTSLVVAQIPANTRNEIRQSQSLRMANSVYYYFACARTSTVVTMQRTDSSGSAVSILL